MSSVLYMILATGMFFFQDTYFSLGGMELSLKNPCALAILFLALLNLTATVRLDRLMVLIRHTAVQALDRKSTRLNSSHPLSSRMPSSA